MYTTHTPSSAGNPHGPTYQITATTDLVTTHSSTDTHTVTYLRSQGLSLREVKDPTVDLALYSSRPLIDPIYFSAR